MTEQEAIKVLNNFDMQVSAKADGAYQSTMGKMACEVAAMALIEIQQYRAIGTVEDCREAREKQMPKQPILDDIYHQNYYCPNCEDFLARKNGDKPHHCTCGQAIDWSEDK